MPNRDSATLALFLSKLELDKALSQPARDAFLSLPTQRRTLDAYRDLVRERDTPGQCSLVETGLVSRYKTLRNGNRQILSFHIAGDFIDLQSALVVVADHGIRTHVRSTFLMIDHGHVLALCAEWPEIQRALWFDTLVDAGIFREWTLNVGRRNARARTAHLLLEFAYRFRQAGMGDGSQFELPVSQNDLADALGVSPVHLNRTLQWLRRERPIRTVSRTVIIEDEPAMVALSGFEPSYLQPQGPRLLAA